MTSRKPKVKSYPRAQLINLCPPKRFNRKLFNRMIRTEQFANLNNNKFAMVNKPTGGLWTSTYQPHDYYLSSWIKWCKDNQSEWIGHDCILIEIETTARVYTIDNWDNLKALYFLYGYEYKDKAKIDWIKVQKSFDIIHLTENGEYECSNPYQILNDSKKLDLYGWDCESSLMLNNVINRFKQITNTRR